MVNITPNNSHGLSMNQNNGIYAWSYVEFRLELKRSL
jgi:hypothetical protein